MKLSDFRSRINLPSGWSLIGLLLGSLSLTFASVSPALAVCDPNAPITRISVASNGTQGNDTSHNPHISDSGQFVLFSSDASTLVTGDSNTVTDAFLYNRLNCNLSRVSVSSGGVQANGNSYGNGLSSDGNVIAIRSSANNLAGSNLKWKF